ncbi:MAG: c-type cytochrome biogenesis protein CcsB [Burkholderiales bacterium]|nr:c-type cytochrome biogenesis protein CcsB [Burkholderiales bacterium]
MNHPYVQTGATLAVNRDTALGALFYGVIGVATCGAYLRLHASFDGYDTAILFLFAILFSVCGRHWRSLRHFTLAMVPLIAAGWLLLPSETLAAPVHSQGLILATGIFVWGATLLFLAGWISRNRKVFAVANAVTWLAVAIGLLAFLLRWRESYALGSAIGHLPVSNLYEVFLVFVLLTSTMVLYLTEAFDAPELAAFAMPIVSAAVGFLFWYGAVRGASSITPLIPALQSYWMKLHVPANFIAYGAFSISAMSSAAWLLARFPFFARRLPERAWIEEITYRAIAVGFVFFTAATILGSLWAAQAWGGYWSWDPKETWALVVWLNYAAWLHMRFVKKLTGAVLSCWALIGLFVTLFAFLGVNMYLSGLHSYGAL